MLKSSFATYDTANHNYILQSLHGCQPSDLQMWGEGCLFLVRQRQKSNLDGSVENKGDLACKFSTTKTCRKKIWYSNVTNKVSSLQRTHSFGSKGNPGPNSWRAKRWSNLIVLQWMLLTCDDFSVMATISAFFLSSKPQTIHFLFERPQKELKMKFRKDKVICWVDNERIK